MTEFLVEVDKEIFDISELLKSITYSDSLNDGPAKLEFTLIDSIDIKNGSTVRFKFSDITIFYGFVFKNSKSRDGILSVIAYDRLRYLKMKDNIVIKNLTLGALLKKSCDKFKLKWGHVTDTNFELPISVVQDKTYLDIFYEGISDTLVGTGKKYVLMDEPAGIALKDMENLKLNLVLGDDSLVYDYEYSRSIDEDFYNKIRITSDISSDGKFIDISENDNESITKFGLIQYFEVLDFNLNEVQAKDKAINLLKLYNREQEILEISALGDVNLRAGNSFYGSIEDIKLNKRVVIKKITHSFIPHHTMDIEVYI